VGLVNSNALILEGNLNPLVAPLPNDDPLAVPFAPLSMLGNGVPVVPAPVVPPEPAPVPVDKLNSLTLISSPVPGVVEDLGSPRYTARPMGGGPPDPGRDTPGCESAGLIEGTPLPGGVGPDPGRLGGIALPTADGGADGGAALPMA